MSSSHRSSSQFPDEDSRAVHVSQSKCGGSLSTVVSVQLPNQAVQQCRWLLDFIDTEGDTELPFSTKEAVDWLAHCFGEVHDCAASVQHAACLKV